METKKTINAKKVLEIRTRLGMTQKQFGEAVGLSQSGLNNIENGYLQADGTPRSTSLETCWRIAELGNVSIEWLIDVTEQRDSIAELLEEVEKLRTVLRVDFSNEYLQLLLEYAARITPREQQMVALLCQRLSETTHARTHEGQEAASLVDKMPEHRRVEALNKLRDLASKKEKAELRRQFGYLIQLIKDETGEDMTAKVEELFHVWLTNGNGKQSIGEEITQKGIDGTQ